MQAIILAAGMGKRLKELTKNNTKCMVRVNGETLIERLLGQIDARNFSRIVIVVGYESKKLRDYIASLSVKTPIVFVENSVYDKTNNIYSLYLAKDFLAESDTILFESDLIFEDAVLDSLLDDERENLALVDTWESWMDGTCLKLSADDAISRFVPGADFDFLQKDEYWKTVNIYKFSRDFALNSYIPFLEAYQKAKGKNEYYEQVLRVIAEIDKQKIKAKRLSDQKWYEIDDEQDLDIAESIFAKGEEKLKKISSRYGGFWRYPKLLDFCYLVNPYFPPKKMLDEIEANFATLLTQYPSGQKVNSLVAAKTFALKAENVAVGNGAAELIKSLLSMFCGKTGIIKPSFEEYAHRLNESDIVEMRVSSDDFSYDENDVISFFDDKKISNLILINPDNPSGNYIAKDGVLRLVEWAKSKKINLVVDESFSDFARELDASFLAKDILEKYDGLFVMKSISKSFGVPGLRLGILASANVKMISAVKKDISIWNINSFAEFYLQISEKYKKSYASAMDKFRNERERFFEKLRKIEGLKVRNSEANFVLAEVTAKINSAELAERLLFRHNILIKDLSQKDGFDGKNFIRLAIRNETENDALIAALCAELNENDGDYIFLFDLDSTVTKKEVAPEIAEKVGRTAQIRAITELGMQGKLPFVESLQKRFDILKDVPLSEIDEIMDKMPLNEKLADFIRKNKKCCWILTGSPEAWIAKIILRLDMKEHCFSSKAESENGLLTRLASVIQKDLIAKQFVQPFVVIGDGSNDVEMAKLADISIGFGGVRKIAPALEKVVDYKFDDEEKLAEFLDTLLFKSAPKKDDNMHSFNNVKSAADNTTQHNTTQHNTTSIPADSFLHDCKKGRGVKIFLTDDGQVFCPSFSFKNQICKTHFLTKSAKTNSFGANFIANKLQGVKNEGQKGRGGRLAKAA